MILEGHGGAEERHQPIAGEAVDGPLIALHHCGRAIEQFVHDLLKSLRVQHRRELHRADDVGEQHRHLFVFARRRTRGDRRAAHIAEARLYAKVVSTRPAPIDGLTDRTDHPPDFSRSVNFSHDRLPRGGAALKLLKPRRRRDQGRCASGLTSPVELLTSAARSSLARSGSTSITAATTVGNCASVARGASEQCGSHVPGR